MTLNLDYYKKHWQQFTQDTIDLDLKANWTYFLDLLKPKAMILDAGCGTGRDSNYFINQGFKVVSIDPTPQFKNVAKSQFDIDILQKEFSDIDWINSFDAIWANASLLHVTYENHPPIFKRLFKALKPNGILFCSYKYNDRLIVKNQREFYCFTKNTFTNFIDNFTRFKVIKIYKEADRRPNRPNEFWLNCILKKPNSRLF